MVLHDFFWLSQDVPDVLKDVHKALKPGGWFGVVDHAAPPAPAPSTRRIATTVRIASTRRT